MSSFPRIIKFDKPKCLNLIGEFYAMYLNFTLSKKVSKNCTSNRIKQTCPTLSRLLRIHSQPKYIWDYNLVVVKTQTNFRRHHFGAYKTVIWCYSFQKSISPHPHPHPNQKKEGNQMICCACLLKLRQQFQTNPIFSISTFRKSRLRFFPN